MSPADEPSRPAADARRPAADRRRAAAALVALLPDDDPAVLAALARLGKAAVPALRAAARHGAPELRSRARDVLLARDRRRAARRLTAYAATSPRRTLGGATLERGLFLLDRFLDPRLDVRGPRARLDALGGELANRIQGRPTGSRRALALVDLLAGSEGFVGDSADYHHPDNVSLARTLERRKGLPLTLCAIYQGVARRAGLEAHILPFPGKVLLELRDGGDRLIVDPFGGGKLLTPRQCIVQLATRGLPFRERFFVAASDRDMLARQAHNLAESLERRRRAGDYKLLAAPIEVLTGAELEVPPSLLARRKRRRNDADPR